MADLACTTFDEETGVLSLDVDGVTVFKDPGSGCVTAVEEIVNQQCPSTLEEGEWPYPGFPNGIQETADGRLFMPPYGGWSGSYVEGFDLAGGQFHDRCVPVDCKPSCGDCPLKLMYQGCVAIVTQFNNSKLIGGGADSYRIENTVRVKDADGGVLCIQGGVDLFEFLEPDHTVELAQRAHTYYLFGLVDCEDGFNFDVQSLVSNPGDDIAVFRASSYTNVNLQFFQIRDCNC